MLWGLTTCAYSVVRGWKRLFRVNIFDVRYVEDRTQRTVENNGVHLRDQHLHAKGLIRLFSVEKLTEKRFLARLKTWDALAKREVGHTDLILDCAGEETPFLANLVAKCEIWGLGFVARLQYAPDCVCVGGAWCGWWTTDLFGSATLRPY